MKTTKMLPVLIMVLSLIVCQAEVRGAIGGSGTANRIPKFTGPTTIGDSAIYEASNRASIGTTSPEKGYRLTVDGAGSLYGIRVRNTGDVGIESTGSNYGVRGSGNSRGVSGVSTNGIGVFGKSTNGYAAEFHGNVRIKDNSGAVIVVELGKGLDYAEGFDVLENKGIRPGAVLIIDPDNAGKLSVSNKPYDRKVAGIVAGAKGQGSGVRLGAGQFDYDVALAGRVYCNVDATEMAVQPGDLLTTSATVGYAMKAEDYVRAQGAILGKAMEKLEKGKKGQILVLVTLQ